jgi:hypothetical protein
MSPPRIGRTSAIGNKHVFAVLPTQSVISTGAEPRGDANERIFRCWAYPEPKRFCRP